MKKIILFVLLLLLILVAIPIVGNKFVKENVDKVIFDLEAKGIELLNAEESFTLLQTHRHYEFLLKSADALLNASRIGIDLKYSNIPLSKDIEVDLYPMSLSSSSLDSIASKDKEFAKYIEDFLNNKGLLYHVQYNLLEESFNGFVKDINETYTLKNNAVIQVKNQNVKFNGKKHKNRLEVITHADIISVNIYDLREKMSFDVHYLDSNISLENKDKTYDLSSNIAFKNLFVSVSNKEINASNFIYNVKASQINKASYKKLQASIALQQSSSNIESALMDILSKGVTLKLNQLNLENISINQKDLGGYTIKAELIVQEDKNLAMKMRISPLFILANIDFELESVISQAILESILSNSPLPASFIHYTNLKAGKVYSDISYKNGSLKINGKKIFN